MSTARTVPAKKHVSGVQVALSLSAGLTVVGLVASVWWLITLGILGLIFTFGAAAAIRKDKSLAAAKPGAVRVETVKQQWVNQTVQRYAAAGWTVEGQSTAKSFGSQARVTMTFRKG